MSWRELSLSALKARMGWSTDDLARIARASSDAVEAWERKEGPVRLEVVLAIGEAADLRDEELGALLRGVNVLPPLKNTGDVMADQQRRLRHTLWVLVQAADATNQNNSWLGRAARGVGQQQSFGALLSLRGALEMQGLQLAHLASPTDLTEGYLTRIADREVVPGLLDLVAIGQALLLTDEAFGALVRWAGVRHVRGELLARDPLWEIGRAHV